MSKEIMQVRKAANVKELIQVLTDMSGGLVASTVYIHIGEADEIRLALVEETLSDGSKVYDINIEAVEEAQDIPEPLMEIMRCDNCYDELEAGRIGLCDDCLGDSCDCDDCLRDSCDCAHRSWYGENHDSACPLAGKARS